TSRCERRGRAAAASSNRYREGQEVNFSPPLFSFGRRPSPLPPPPWRRNRRRKAAAMSSSSPHSEAALRRAHPSRMDGNRRSRLLAPAAAWAMLRAAVSVSYETRNVAVQTNKDQGAYVADGSRAIES
ncbi:hypothetical protein Dimus_026752, partial [Dionaea muscipula]